MKLAIRRVDLVSLGKFGCLIGVVLACLPSLLFGLLGLGLVNILQGWLENWQEVSITVLGREIAQFDFVRLLGLTEFLTRLQSITGASFATVALVVLGLALLGGLVLGLIVVVAGLVYNLLAAATGGIVVDAETLAENRPPE
jgi:hypothetical protein